MRSILVYGVQKAKTMFMILSCSLMWLWDTNTIFLAEKEAFLFGRSALSPSRVSGLHASAFALVSDS